MSLVKAFPFSRVSLLCCHPTRSILYAECSKERAPLRQPSRLAQLMVPHDSHWNPRGRRPLSEWRSLPTAREYRWDLPSWFLHGFGPLTALGSGSWTCWQPQCVWRPGLAVTLHSLALAIFPHEVPWGGAFACHMADALAFETFNAGWFSSWRSAGVPTLIVR